MTDGDVTKEACVNDEQIIRKEQQNKKTFVPFPCMSDMVPMSTMTSLDKDLTEHEVRPVRLVNLCSDKKHTASDC